jgi:uncharacterized membrane-anchored protein YjiN (DUF445 family)
LTDERIADTRLSDLRRMQALATLLLIAMAAIFVATSLTKHHHWFWLGCVRAFAEAGMVGACADWFAVVALFRRPFGLPIPHTGVIPNNKKRIGGALGRFITNNFLTTRMASERLAKVDIVGGIAGWISDPVNSSKIAEYTGHQLPQVAKSLIGPELGDFVGKAARRGVEAIPAAPLASKALSILWAQGQTQVLLDQAIDFAEASLMRHKDLVIRKVSEQSSRLIPKWVDGIIANRVLNGLVGMFQEMHKPDHPWRAELKKGVQKLVNDLATDPDMCRQGEKVKAELLVNPVFLQQVAELWAQIEKGLSSDNLSAGADAIAEAIQAGLEGLGKWLEDSPERRAKFNRRLRLVTLRALLPRRAEIGSYIAHVVENWDSTTLVNKLELQVGKDLQYIRINGTLVGGLVGLVIFIVSQTLGFA